MNQRTTKILAAINIIAGVSLCFIIIKIVLDGMKVIVQVFYSVPAELWTQKHSLLVIMITLLVWGLIYLGGTLAIGSIKIGTKRLQSIATQTRIKTLLKELEEQNHGTQTTNNNPPGTSKSNREED